MKTKMVYLTVAVEMDAEADEKEVMENCDYFFDSAIYFSLGTSEENQQSRTTGYERF